jgi:hypothetical protein
MSPIVRRRSDTARAWAACSARNRSNAGRGSTSLAEEAIDAKIAEQEKFVGWWDGDEGVRPAGNQPIVAERGQLSVFAATLQTGISKQQVSRWRKNLAPARAARTTLRASCGTAPRPYYRTSFSIRSAVYSISAFQ